VPDISSISNLSLNSKPKDCRIGTTITCKIKHTTDKNCFMISGYVTSMEERINIEAWRRG
jgi:hypothetical protein